MSLTKEELKGFDKVFENILSPVVEETKEDIDSILEANPELKEELDVKVQTILKLRDKSKGEVSSND